MSGRKKALVLSGGGGRGAYHVGVLRFLEEHEWVPDIVVGTSIGAVNGAALASGHNSRSLWALWKRLRTKDVQRLDNPLDGHFLDTSPLRETLLREGWVNFERINSEETAVHLRITATDIGCGDLHVFGNTSDMRGSSKMRREPMTLDHIVASCSIPLVYPSTKLHEASYWDGAVIANTPLGAAIDAGGDELEEIVVVMMTPWENQLNLQNLPQNLLEAASTTLEWALLASFRAHLKLFRIINEMAKMRDKMSEMMSTHAELLEGYELNVPTKYRAVRDPMIVAPERFLPVGQIVRYREEGHNELYALGYDDAKRAWRKDGRSVEGES